MNTNSMRPALASDHSGAAAPRRVKAEQFDYGQVCEALEAVQRQEEEEKHDPQEEEKGEQTLVISCVQKRRIAKATRKNVRFPDEQDLSDNSMHRRREEEFVKQNEQAEMIKKQNESTQHDREQKETRRARKKRKRERHDDLHHDDHDDDDDLDAVWEACMYDDLRRSERLQRQCPSYKQQEARDRPEGSHNPPGVMDRPMWMKVQFKPPSVCKKELQVDRAHQQEQASPSQGEEEEDGEGSSYHDEDEALSDTVRKDEDQLLDSLLA
jgi:hypothetical protein